MTPFRDAGVGDVAYAVSTTARPCYNPAMIQALMNFLFQGLMDTMGTLEGKVGTLNGHVTTLDGNVSALNGGIALLASQVNGLNEQLAALSDRIGTLHTEVASLNGNIHKVTRFLPGRR